MPRLPTILERWLPHDGDDAFAAARKQMMLIAALIGGAWLLAALHLGVIARPLFVAGALAIALFYIRRSPWLYLTAALWFWTISPFVRRVIDFYAGFQATNIVLLTPNLVTLLMLRPILTSRTLWRRPEAASGMLLLGPVFYGLAVSFAKGEAFAGAVASLDWLIPLLFYFYLIDRAPRIDELEAPFRAFIPLNIFVVAVYGLYAFYYPTPWDAAWTEGAFGKHPNQMNPFSVLNSTGACAVWLGALILFSLSFRTRMSALLMPAAILFLALTQVRMTAGAVALGLAAAALFGEWRMRRSLLVVLVALVAAFAAIATFDPQVTDGLVARFSTVGDLQNDGSAQAREQLYRTAPALISDNPLGLGIGALGKGVRVGGAEGMDDFNSGVIAPFVAFGWIGGIIYIFGSFTIVAQAFLAARKSQSSAALMLAIVALTGLASSIFTMSIGVQGVTIWFSAGYASAIAIRAQMLKALENRRRSLWLAQADVLTAANNAVGHAGPHFLGSSSREL